MRRCSDLPVTHMEVWGRSMVSFAAVVVVVEAYESMPQMTV